MHLRSGDNILRDGRNITEHTPLPSSPKKRAKHQPPPQPPENYSNLGKILFMLTAAGAVIVLYLLTRSTGQTPAPGGAVVNTLNVDGLSSTVTSFHALFLEANTPTFQVSAEKSWENIIAENRSETNASIQEGLFGFNSLGLTPVGDKPYAIQQDEPNPVFFTQIARVLTTEHHEITLPNARLGFFAQDKHGFLMKLLVEPALVDDVSQMKSILREWSRESATPPIMMVLSENQAQLLLAYEGAAHDFLPLLATTYQDQPLQKQLKAPPTDSSSNQLIHLAERMEELAIVLAAQQEKPAPQTAAALETIDHAAELTTHVAPPIHKARQLFNQTLNNMQHLSMTQLSPVLLGSPAPLTFWNKIAAPVRPIQDDPHEIQQVFQRLAASNEPASPQSEAMHTLTTWAQNPTSELCFMSHNAQGLLVLTHFNLPGMRAGGMSDAAIFRAIATQYSNALNHGEWPVVRVLPAHEMDSVQGLIDAPKQSLPKIERELMQIQHWPPAPVDNMSLAMQGALVRFATAVKMTTDKVQPSIIMQPVNNTVAPPIHKARQLFNQTLKVPVTLKTTHSSRRLSRIQKRPMDADTTNITVDPQQNTLHVQEPEHKAGHTDGLGNAIPPVVTEADKPLGAFDKHQVVEPKSPPLTNKGTGTRLRHVETTSTETNRRQDALDAQKTKQKEPQTRTHHLRRPVQPDAGTDGLRHTTPPVVTEGVKPLGGLGEHPFIEPENPSLTSLLLAGLMATATSSGTGHAAGSTTGHAGSGNNTPPITPLASFLPVTLPAAIEPMKVKTQSELNQEIIDEKMAEFALLVLKLALTKNHPNLRAKHQDAMATLATSLKESAREFRVAIKEPNYARALGDSAFMTFRIDVINAVTRAESQFKEDPDSFIWRNILMPLTNAICKALDSIMKFIRLRPKTHELSLFMAAPLVAQTAWETSKVRKGLLTLILSDGPLEQATPGKKPSI